MTRELSGIAFEKKPLWLLPHAELVWRLKHKCKHGHNYIEHAPCFTGYHEERIGFLDVECEDLKADYGITFSYCIKVENENKIYFDTIRPEDFKKFPRGKEDTRLIRNLIKDMENFDRLVGHFSSLFDFPFIRTRAVICNVPFPHYGVYNQTDTWRILKHKFKLSRNSLENACRKLLGYTEKDHLSLEIKHGCLRGEKKAIAYTLSHNKKDVRDTERLYHAIIPFIRKTNTSL